MKLVVLIVGFIVMATLFYLLTFFLQIMLAAMGIVLPQGIWVFVAFGLAGLCCVPLLA
ncbi:hypothetical protein [Scytonema sp. NUACC26]|uniref:hypothetical protein n=1 Tax=Scytonema sp. NUACC26 TaxID=3140176 RepID=UPI0038B4088F